MKKLDQRVFMLKVNVLVVMNQIGFYTQSINFLETDSMEIIRRDIAKLKEELNYLMALIRKNETEIRRLEREIKK